MQVIPAMQATYRNQVRMVMTVVLVVILALAAVMPLVAHAMFTNVVRDGTDGSVSGNTIVKADGSVTVVGNGQVTTVSPTSNGYTVTTTTYNGNGQPVSQTTINVGKAQQYTFTTYNTQTTITKTYTQYVYYTTVINNVITKYMLPTIQWTLTYVNIGQYQQPGYHSVGSEKLFTPGFGGGGRIFVPVYSQEAIYAFNIAPSVKPQVTGWYVAGQSQYTTSSTSKSATPPQLTSIQQTVDTIKQLATVTIPNITKSTTYWNYNTQVISKPYPYTPPPFYYSQQDINSAYAAAWSDLTHGDVLGAIYETGRGLYMQTWNTLASAVYSAYQFMQSASNAFNTATLAKSIGLAFNLINPFNW